MKHLVIVALAAAVVTGVSLSAEGRPEAVVDLILVAGQSNAVGYDAKPSELPADPNDKEILYWWRCGDPPPDDHDSTSGGKWTHLKPVPVGNPDLSKQRPRQYGNFAQAAGGFGPEIGLARTLRAKEGKRLAVVKVAFSGTSIFTDWHPSDPGDAGACYRSLVKETRRALAAAKDQKIRLRLRAFAWVQGESDANAAKAPAYENALAEMITALRKDLAAANLVGLLAVNTRFGGGNNAFMPRIVEAQKAVAAKDERCVYVDTASAAIANAAHFSSSGTLDVGQRMAEALLKLEAAQAPAKSTESAARNAAEGTEIGKLLKSKGAVITESKGIIISVTIQDGSKLTAEDFRQITRLAHLKMASLSNCLNDDRLAQLAALRELEYLQTNLADITDGGIKPLVQLKNLRNLKFFHPGKAFTGAGLIHLAAMPNLERLTVAGSLNFNDEGMAAVARLTGLKEFRTWHAGQTNEGVKKLKELRNLKSLYLGQRLTYKKPACPTDETIAILAELTALESLQLDEARLTFSALQQLKRLPALKRLTLGGIEIPKEDIEHLKRELPKVKIEWTEPNEAYQRRIRALFGG